MSINKVLGMILLLLAMASAPAFAAKVDVNKADAATLMSNLNGVGPVKAKAIIDYRKKNGSFKSLDDLMKVPGIGEGIIKSNRSNLSLKGGLSKSTAKKPASTSKASSTKEKSASASKSAKAKETKAKKDAKEKSSKASKSDKDAKAKAKADAKKAKADKAKKAKAAKDKKEKAKKAKEKAAK